MNKQLWIVIVVMVVLLTFFYNNIPHVNPYQSQINENILTVLDRHEKEIDNLKKQVAELQAKKH